MAGVLYAKYENLTEEFLIVDAIRGKDSVGLCVISQSSEVKVHKKAIGVQDFLDLPAYKRCFRGSNKIVIGHNRAATRGAVDNNNAHPFEFENVVGVHNGTLRYRGKLPKADFINDSEHLYWSINSQGIAKTWTQLEGAAALAFYDKKEDSLNLIRNKERPLYYTFTKDRKAIFWASESWMLSGILKRNGIDFVEITQLKEDFLYKFNLKDITPKTVLDKVSIKKLQPAFSGFEGNYHFKGNSYSNRPTSSSTSTFYKDKKHKVGDTIKISYTGGLPKKGVKFIKAFITGDSCQKVIVYLNGSSRLINLIKTGCVRYMGRLNGYDANNNLLVQGNSVSANIVKGIIEEESVMDSQGVLITKRDLAILPLQAKDCVWCSSPIQFENGNTLIDNSTTLCPGCTEDEQVKQYFTEL